MCLTPVGGKPLVFRRSTHNMVLLVACLGFGESDVILHNMAPPFRNGMGIGWGWGWGHLDGALGL